MLGSFIIILFIFLGANVAGIVYLFAQGQFPNEVEFAANELENTIPYYKQGKFLVFKHSWFTKVFFTKNPDSHFRRCFRNLVKILHENIVQ